MNKTIQLTFLIALVFLWVASGIDGAAPLAPGGGPEITTVATPAEFLQNPPPGRVREVTAYNVGDKRQTDDTPCLGATGENLCRLVARGLKVCAANFVATETILNIEGYGECVVLDRTNRRFSHRVDIAMREDEADRALEFGIQRRYVEIKRGNP